MHILENPYIWHLFRKIVTLLFKIDKNKSEILDTLGGGINKPGISVLDIGCGIGNFSKLFNGQYTGIDNNPKYIEYAKKKFSTEKRLFICADAVTYSLNEKNKYDLVCIFEFLHHIDDDLCLQILQSSGRFAKEFIVIIDPVYSRENTLIKKFLIRFDRGKYIRSNVHLKELILKAGLEILENPFGNVYLCSNISG